MRKKRNRFTQAEPAVCCHYRTEERIMAKGNNSQNKDKKKAKGNPKKDAKSAPLPAKRKK
jgi:hypothetical protein